LLERFSGACHYLIFTMPSIRAATCGAVVAGVALGFGTLGGYESWSAERKQAYLWDSMTMDTLGDAFMNPIQTLFWVTQLGYLRSMQETHSDWRDSNHHKISHGVGGHALAHFEWLDNEYTGMFQKADKCVVRMANAAAPGGLTMQSYGPNMGVKCLRDGEESANLQFIWQIDGYSVLPEGAQNSCSYFEAPLSNHNPLRDDVDMALHDLFIGNFDKVDPRSMLLGVSSMATASQDGTAVSEPNFPFALVMVPSPELNYVRCTFKDSISQLRNLESAGHGAGSKLYDVYAVHDPETNPTPDSVNKIGSLVLDTAFTPSTYGDTQLFFRHTFFQTELNVLSQADESDRAMRWSHHVNNEEHYKTEGAGLYWPLIQAKDSVAV
jgi:hypothetical protein